MGSVAWRRAAGVGRLALGLAFLYLVAGCGEPIGEVTGKVTYKGTPLQYGTVTMVCSNGLSVQGEIQPDGTYTIKKVPAGPVKVGVESVDPARGELAKKMAAGMREKKEGVLSKGPKQMVDDTKYHKVPKNFNDPDSSGLKFNVEKGLNTIDIPLQ
jgi:hypothetical protein